MHFKSTTLALTLALVSGAVSAQSVKKDAPSVVTTVESVGSSSGLKEDQPTGAYGQPDWVQSRRFATTRVHIQRNPWEMAVEQWVRSRYNDGEWKHRFQEEFEIGLPGRLQADVYWDWTYEDGKSDHLDVAAELRWGLADWGKIPLNPALYFEYKWTDDDRGGDVIEPKILFGEDFGNGWHWGLNLVYERETSGEEAEEYAVAQAISKTIVDGVFSAGLEMKWTRETVGGDRGNPEQKFVIGPSFQWRVTPNFHIDLVAMAGCTEDSPDFEGWLVMGYDFGGKGEKKGNAPISGLR